LKLPMADSIMLATARSFNATLWSQDAEIEGMDGVRYVCSS
jgi:predicted nucleic acid-binding protein